MSDLFGIAKSGLQAYKESLATTGQNIANVGNENYARREANLSQIKSASSDSLSISSNKSYGVKVDGITRAFDQFIETQLQSASSGLSFATSQTLVLEQLEKVLRPGETTVSKKLQEFFAALSAVSQDPSDLASRHVAVDAAEATCNSIRMAAAGITDLRDLVKENVKNNITDFNNIILSLHDIQKEILGNSSPQSTPNDLLDQRDALLKELSDIADVGVTYSKDGSVNVSLGLNGQGRTLLSGLNVKKLQLQQSDGNIRIFLENENGAAPAKIQIQSGKIAGHLAADITLHAAKKSLDDLTVRFVREINETHRYGVDLEGDLGTDFFGLDAIEVQKISTRDSTIQLRVEGSTTSFMNQALSVEFQSESGSWSIFDENGNLLKNFNQNTELYGLNFSFDGDAALGDSFVVKITNTNSEQLKCLLTDGRRIAASSFYSVEPNANNKGDAAISLTRFSQKIPDHLNNLGDMLSEPRNSANSVNFRDNGILGYLKDVDTISNLASLKSQAKIQFGVQLDSLDANSKLKINLGSAEHVFSVGGYIGQISDYSELANFLNIGAIKSDGDGLSFSDLGLFSGGTSVSLTVMSDDEADVVGDGVLSSGSLNSNAGILVPGDSSDGTVQIFTREGVQLSGKPLSEEDAALLINEANGFNAGAKYSQAHIAIGSNSNYLGANISRLTASGLETRTITGAGFSDNLNVYASNAFPTARTTLAGSIDFQTNANYEVSVTSDPGMMAGQLAEKINSEVGAVGLQAYASNKLELFEISDGRLQFDIFGRNSVAHAVDVTIVNGETSNLVSAINSNTFATGITAAVSGSGAILLFTSDGNEIALKDFSIENGNISLRQIDEFGESVQATAASVSSGEHIVSGGQINIKSPDSFSITYNAQTLSSQSSVFDSSFIEKFHDVDNNTNRFSFTSNYSVDGSALDETGAQGVVASSSYSLTLSSDNTLSDITSNFKPKVYSDFSPGAISAELISQFRSISPKTRFSGDEFTLSDGFPANGDNLEFRLGDQKYFATLKNDLEYTISGSDVIINGETFTFSEALEKLVSASTFVTSGPEADRITVGFEETGSGFRLYAVAKEGVLSGHPLILSEDNSIEQKNVFHISNNSTAEIFSTEFDLNQANKENFAELVIGSSTYYLSFDTATDAINVEDGAGNSLVLPSTVGVSLVSSGTSSAKLKVTIDENVSDREMRLKANDNSGTFGIVTASAQLTLSDGYLEISNYNNQRVKTDAAVSSLADEIISISGLNGEDLIVASTGTRRPKLIGELDEVNHTLHPREMLAKVDTVNDNLIRILDKSSGDLLGSREINGGNSFLFRGFDWQIDGSVSTSDSFDILTSNIKKDDASNLTRLIELSSLSGTTAKGGYTDAYNSLVTSAGFDYRASEQNLENSKVKYDFAVDRKSSFSGVDLDTEAAKLLEQQQAYQALARVLSTAKELLDTLLRSM